MIEQYSFLTLKELGIFFLPDIFLPSIGILLIFALGWWGIFTLFQKKGWHMPFWLGYVGLGALLIMRIIGLGYIHQSRLDNITIELLISFAIVLFLYFLTRKTPVDKAPKTVDKKYWKDVTAVLLLILLCVSTMWHLDRHNFLFDEFYQLGAAAGYNETGEFFKYNFRLGEVTEGRYPRAFISTWFIAQSINIFGIDEFGARFPSAMFYGLFIIGVYFVMRHWKKDRTQAFLIAAFFLFSVWLIAFGHYTRFYSPFMLTAGATLITWYLTIKSSFQGAYKRAIGFGTLSIGLSFLSYHLQPLIILFFPALGFSLFVEFIFRFIKDGWQSPVVKRIFSWLLIAVLLMGGIGLLDVILGFLPWHRLEPLSNVQWTYELYPFRYLPLGGLAIALYLIAVVRSFTKPYVYRYLAIVPIPFFFFHIFLFDHWPAERYFALPLILTSITIGLAFIELLQKLAPRKKKVASVFVITGFFLILCPLSFPGIQTPYFFQPSYADRPVANAYVIYEYIKEHKDPNDVVMLTNLFHYYWGKDTETRVIVSDKLNRLKEKHVDETLAQEQRGWIVFRKPKKYQEIIKGLVKREGVEEVDIPNQEQATPYRIFYFDVTQDTNEHN